MKKSLRRHAKQFIGPCLKRKEKKKKEEDILMSTNDQNRSMGIESTTHHNIENKICSVHLMRQQGKT